MSAGLALEDVDLSSFDSEYANGILMAAFRDCREDLPEPSELDFGKRVRMSTFDGIQVDLACPLEQRASTAECLLLARDFFREVRFEELWALLMVVMNEQKLVLVSNDVARFGRAMYTALTRLSLFCMLKPFSWEYPAVVYSKDEELLEAPFPLICGISRELFVKSRVGEAAAAVAGRFVFDLDKSEFVLAPKDPAIARLACFDCRDRREKLERLHEQHFNNAKSHVLSFGPADKLYDNRHLCLAEELTDELAASDDDVQAYLAGFQALWQETIVSPLGELTEKRDEKTCFAKVVEKRLWMREFMGMFSSTQIFSSFVARELLRPAQASTPA